MVWDFDVVVVGAGPVGCVAALGLAQLGMRVAILEKRSWETVAPPMLNGMAEAQDGLLHKLGLLNVVKEAQVNSGRRFLLGVRHGRPVETVWPEGMRRRFFKREPVDRWLRAQVRQRVTEVFDEVAQLEFSAGNRLEFLSHGRRQDVGCRLLVVADGQRSKTADLLGIPLDGGGSRRSYRGALFKAHGSEDGFALQLTAQRGVNILAFGMGAQGGYVELEFDPDVAKVGEAGGGGGRQAQDGWLADAARWPVLRDVAASPGSWTPLGSITRLTGVRTALHRPGVVLLGDAAACLDPIGSSGLLVGLQATDDMVDTIEKQGLTSWSGREWEARYRERILRIGTAARLMRHAMAHPHLMAVGMRTLGGSQRIRGRLARSYNAQVPFAELQLLSRQA